jgi:2-keto-3-deoxy-L-fuconate dehydrogenase
MVALPATMSGRPAHYVFANAGVGAAGDVLTATDATWQWAWEVNVTAAIRTLRLWWPHLREGRGKAVATVSSAALQSYPGAGPYRASKAALLAALEGLHYQSRGSGVTVHALCPGMVQTQVTDVTRYAESAQIAPLGANPFADYLRQAMQHAEPADRFAERVLDTLWEGAPFYWFTHPETRGWIEARHRAIETGGLPFSDFTSSAP